jgi:phosphoglycolate phosphatase
MAALATKRFLGRVGIVMISAIFDFDGVLVDSRPTIGDCLIDALGEFGISAPSPLETSLLVGPPLELGLTEFLTRRGISLEELPEIIARFRDSYAVKSIQSTYLFPGIREMLDSLYSEKIPMYIATSKPRLLTVPLVKELAIEEYFSMIQAPDGDLTEDKTETLRKLLCAISNSEIDSYRRFLMIGDREADIRAARENNIESIGVSWGYGTQDELLTVKPNYLVQTPNLLFQILISEKNQMKKN